MDHAIDLVVTAILFICGLVFEFVGFIDGWVARLMLSVGIPPGVQLLILIVVAIVVIAYVFRVLGRLLAGLVLVLLVLLVLHKAFPDVQVSPQYYLHLPGEVHT